MTRIPVGDRSGLGDPRAPSRTGPSWRWTQNPDERHKKLYSEPKRKRFPGDHMLATTSSIRYRPAWRDVFLSDPPMLGLDAQKRLRQNIRDAALFNERFRVGYDGTARVDLNPGLSAIQLAEAVRQVPGTPAGRRGVYEVPKRLVERGKKRPGVPANVLEAMVLERSTVRTREGTPIPPAGFEDPHKPRNPALAPFLVTLGVLGLALVAFKAR